MKRHCRSPVQLSPRCWIQCVFFLTTTELGAWVVCCRDFRIIWQHHRDEIIRHVMIRATLHAGKRMNATFRPSPTLESMLTTCRSKLDELMRPLSLRHSRPLRYRFGLEGYAVIELLLRNGRSVTIICNTLQMIILEFLGNQGAAGYFELANKLDVSVASVTSTVDDLCNQRLIVRRDHDLKFQLNLDYACSKPLSRLSDSPHVTGWRFRQLLVCLLQGHGPCTRAELAMYLFSRLLKSAHAITLSEAEQYVEVFVENETSMSEPYCRVDVVNPDRLHFVP